MGTFDGIKGILVGLILIAAGWVMIDAKSGIDLIVSVGWIFFIGGIAVVALSIYTTVKG